MQAHLCGSLARASGAVLVREAEHDQRTAELVFGEGIAPVGQPAKGLLRGEDDIDDRRAGAERIAALRDSGERRLVFLIGGADGLDPALVAEAREAIAFGPATWPHALARAMLAEQLYRAVTLLAGSPYHRD